MKVVAIKKKLARNLLICIYLHCDPPHTWPLYCTGMHQAGGQGGQLPPQILADQKAPPGSGGAPHYYLPPRIFDPWCIPVMYELASLF